MAGLLEAQDRGGDAAFAGGVAPFLAKHCVGCHNARQKAGNLDLSGFGEAGAARRAPAVWVKVLDKIGSGKMPPPPVPPPGKAEVAAVSDWIRAAIPLTVGRQAENPGRVTARRLNRSEYNNTIRDLLGVGLRPADEFPLDDSGYGFDNIGDVLSLSPLLMEKYVAAARRVSQVAVYGEAAPARPGLLTRLLAKKGHETGAAAASSTYLPYSMRGALYGSYYFPVDGEYEFRIRVSNFRGQDPKDLSPELKAQMRRWGKMDQTEEEKRVAAEEARRAFAALEMVFAVDGKREFEGLVEGSMQYNYARGAFVSRVKLKAGEHFLRASFPEMADMVDPRGNINPDGRRKVYVEYMEIVGPYNAGPRRGADGIFVCREESADCARRIVARLAERAYRRPVTEKELKTLTGLAGQVRANGDSFQEGIRVALEAILLSPHFLFRVERDPAPDKGTPAAHVVSDYELASRLSYFLWASMPDAELLGHAADGTLRSPGVLHAQVRRMLADGKSAALAENFGAQWLNLRVLERHKPDPERFPTVDDELLDAMRKETMMFAGAVLKEDRSILEFLDGRFTFVNGPLARHYGISGVSGEEFQRVALSDDRRGGLLTQAAILTVSSFPTRTSPVLRGKWVLENLMGAPPPPPPADVPALEEQHLGTSASMRERLEQHRANPKCAGCHDQMDPIGFGLENYDAVGAWRSHEGKFAIDASGVLPGGRRFQGARELKEILKAQADAFTRNLTEKMLTYALGRGLEGYDQPTVAEISRKVAEREYRFSALVEEIVHSKPFQMRSRE